MSDVSDMNDMSDRHDRFRPDSGPDSGRPDSGRVRSPHPDDGALRSDLDAPDPAVADHLERCPECQVRREALAADAVLAASAVAALGGAPPAAARRLRSVPSGNGVAPDPRGAPSQGPAPMARPGTRAPLLGRAAAVIALLAFAAAAVTPSVQAVAVSALDVFRAERIEVVAFDPARMESDLMALGELGELTGEPADPVAVPDVAAAAAVAGFTPAVPADAPAGAPTVWAVAPSQVRVVFSSEQRSDLPAELDGAVLRIAMPGMVAQEWGDGPGDPQAAPPGSTLMVVESGAPEVQLEGSDLATLRAWVLEQPDLSTDLVDQLAAIGDWRTTLPLPLPDGDVAWRDVTVNGTEGVAFGDESGLVGAVVWEREGRIHGVAGNAPVSHLQAVAASVPTG